MVRSATRAELPEVGRVLAEAFHDDPVWCWLAGTGSRERWLAKASRWFTAEATVYFDGPGEVMVDEDLGGAALWGAPGRWRAGVKDTLKVALPSLSLFGTNLPRALTTNTRLEKQHPTQPHHWYLGYLGTRPDRQGRGVGGALVSEVTSRCDQVGLPAYLESSKAENLGFYARLGFVEQQEVQLRNGPLLWTMWREPKT